MNSRANPFDAGMHCNQTAPGQTVVTVGGPPRPPGKRGNPDHKQFTAYIRRDTHHQVKLALLRELKGRQFSDLVEELLCAWLKSHR